MTPIEAAPSWRARLHHEVARAVAGEADLDPLLAPGCIWHGAHPMGDMAGPERIGANWLAPLRRALPGLMRRGEIAIGGTSRTGSGDWIAWLGHYVGMLEAPLFGIAPHGKLVFLRCGEFYRVEQGRITEAFILPDLPDLARQAGRPILPALLGTEMLFPGPATHDGVLPSGHERSEPSAKLVEAMLFDLHAFDPVN